MVFLKKNCITRTSKVRIVFFSLFFYFLFFRSRGCLDRQGAEALALAESAGVLKIKKCLI